MQNVIGVNGDFNDGPTWVGGVAPGPNDDVEIVAGVHNTSVSISANAACRDLTLDATAVTFTANVTLRVNRTMLATNGGGPSAPDTVIGTIECDDVTYSLGAAPGTDGAIRHVNIPTTSPTPEVLRIGRAIK